MVVLILLRLETSWICIFHVCAYPYTFALSTREVGEGGTVGRQKWALDWAHTGTTVSKEWAWAENAQPSFETPKRQPFTFATGRRKHKKRLSVLLLGECGECSFVKYEYLHPPPEGEVPKKASCSCYSPRCDPGGMSHPSFVQLISVGEGLLKRSFFIRMQKISKKEYQGAKGQKTQKTDMLLKIIPKRL